MTTPAFVIPTPPPSPPMLDYTRHSDRDVDGDEWRSLSPTNDASESGKEGDVDDDNSTALAPGAPIHIFSLPAIALYLQMIAVSCLQNLLPPLKVYLFTAYLHGSTTHVWQLTALENIAWTFRVFFAILSDVVPVFGYKRKFWLGFGWLVTLVGVAIMAFSDFGAPFCDPKDYPTCWNPKANTTKAAYDFGAPDRVSWYRIPTLVATLGVVIVTASVDGLMVEYAQREPFSTRGQIQSMMYALMGSGALMARFFNQLFLNGARYAGNYDFSAGPNVPYWMGVAMALAALTGVLGLVVEPKKRASHDLRSWSAGLWTLLTSRVVFQLLAFRFAFNLFATITGSPIYAWVTNLDMGWINITPRMLFVPATMHYGRFALQWNWRRVVAVSTVSNVVLMALATFFVIYDVSRNAWVFTALFLLTGIPVALINLVTGFAMVEMAGVGYEAVIAGLWATIRDLNVPIANKVRTSLVEEFPAVMSMKSDTHTQNQVAYPHIIGFSIQVAGLVWLVLLPSQKTPLAMMKSHGASRVAGALVVLGYIALVAFSWQQALDKY